METIAKIFLFLLAALAMMGLTAGISALIAYIVMLLWNFIVVELHRADLQVSFWVAWAVMFLIGLISAPFRSRASTSR